MERLKINLAHTVQNLQQLGGNPTAEQVAGKTKAIAAAIEKDSGSFPGRVKEIICEAFDDMGWDYRRRVPSRPSGKLTKASMIKGFQTMLEEIGNWSPPVTPSSEELGSLSLACSRLWDLDIHRCVADEDYILNFQHGKKMWDDGDMAPEPFFTFVDEKVFERPTFKAFIALLDNYFACTGEAEVVTAEEKRENMQFLNMIMDTAVMQYAHQYLLLSGHTKAKSRDEFIRELNNLWFGLYTRKVRNDSSGFEHVFVGEIKDDTDEIIGFHNWIQLYLEEKRGTFDYQGFVKPKRRGMSSHFPASREQLVTIQFAWKGALKRASSSLIGTSPEFEIALYTLCFFSGNAENQVQLGPYKTQITCHKFPSHPRPGQKQYLATSFPSEVPLDENEAATLIQARVRGRSSYKAREGKR